jgi:hypothetical protein
VDRFPPVSVDTVIFLPARRDVSAPLGQILRGRSHGAAVLSA